MDNATKTTKTAPALFMSRELAERLLSRRSFASKGEIKAILALPEEERAKKTLTRTLQDFGDRQGTTWTKIEGRHDTVSVLVNPADAPLEEALEPRRNWFWYCENCDALLEGARRAQARLNRATDEAAHNDPDWRSAHARLNRFLQGKRAKRRSCQSCQEALRELEAIEAGCWEENPAELTDDERDIYHWACRALNGCPSCSEYLDPRWEALEDAERESWWACAQRLAPSMHDELGCWTEAAMAPEEEEEEDFGLI